MAQKYVAKLPEKLAERLHDKDLEAVSLIIEGNYKAAEKAFELQYQMMVFEEGKLPVGTRYHKGASLHSLGISILMQKEPMRIQEGYQKILLAYIEDLLDFDNIDQVRSSLAYKELLLNPSIKKELLESIEQYVKRLKAGQQIPRNPEDILKAFEGKVLVATAQTREITMEQVRNTMDEFLEKKGKIEQRVFVGGSYKNIALLRHIASIVEDFDFVAIMPIELPATSDPAYEKFIHDVSIEMLQKCSYAIFEVTISNGHLMEIERARDFKDHLRTMLAYQTTRQEDRPMVTKMLMTRDFKKVPYRNFSELTTEIRAFLAT